MPLGFIDARIKDRIKFTFSVVKEGSDKKETIKEFIHEIHLQGLVWITSQEGQPHVLIEMNSWQPREWPLTLNYDGFSHAPNLNTMQNQLLRH